MADTTQLVLSLLSVLCALPFILFILLLVILFVRSRGGGRNYLLHGRLDKVYRAGFFGYGGAEFGDDSVLLTPPDTGPIRILKKDIISAEEMGTLLGKKVYFFYRNKGFLSVFIVSLFPGESLGDNLSGVSYHKRDLFSTAMKHYRYLLEKKDQSLVAGEPLFSERMGGSLILADAQWPGPKMRKGGEWFPLFLPVSGAGIGIKIYKDALVLTNPIYPDILVRKKDILAIEPLGKSLLYKSMTIRHKAENLPERIDYARKNMDEVLARLEEAGYPVRKPKKLQ